MSTLTVPARSARRSATRRARPGRPGGYLRRSGLPIPVRPTERRRPGAPSGVSVGRQGARPAPAPLRWPTGGAGLVAAPAGLWAPVGRGAPASTVPTTAARSVRAVPAPVRLTRRGRLLVTALVTATLVAGLATLAVAIRPVVAGHGPVAAAERVTVRPGDTLWSIAERVAPRADPRDTIAGIESLNHLSSSSVPAGVVLQVPADG